MANLTISPQASAASYSMASSSSASTSYSPLPWDVFINHRGPDVKRTFASYLYRSLDSRGLRVFLDKEELEAGQNISSQIEHAIRGASVHIAIFSPTYAESTWCLDELVLMVESVKSGKIILPVFYKVEPFKVRHTVKGGAYADALRKLEQKTELDPETGKERPRYNSDNFRKWRGALSFAADLSGFLIRVGDDEGELLDKIVESVLKSVPKPLLKVAKYPTGLNQKLREFGTTVLQKQESQCVEAKVVGIWGVGGVGKTTLAKEFFNLRRSHYSKSSFLSHVRETIKRNSVNYLQCKLLEDLTGIKKQIESPDEGIRILEYYLSSCYALIVVDDVDNASQIDALLSFRAVLNPDSLILATTRDKHVLISSGVLESSIYNMKGLSQLHSKELFCCYALNGRFPSQEFADLTDRFVEACDGLPLLLKVLGALVCGRCESYWEATLEELDMGLPNTEIQKRHSRSCGILNLEFVATEYRCLERILDKLETQTLWQHESGAPLQVRELRVSAGSSFSKFPKSIGKLKCLEKITISADPDMLKSFKSLPEEFCELPPLKYLDLENCEQITSLPDSFGLLTRLLLQDIKLDVAKSLRTLPESFGNLTHLDLKGCRELAFSGTTLGNITTLEYLDISFCCNVTELPTQLEHQLSLKELHMDGVRLKELPSWIGNLCNLESLQLALCEIEHLPQELMKMNNLLYLEVGGCPLLELPFKRIEEERELNKLESFHDDDKCLFALKEISLSHTEISEVFFSGCVCPNLQSLVLMGCEELTQIGEGFVVFQNFNIWTSLGV